MAKEFTYKGKNTEELKKMGSDDFLKLTTSRIRRSMKRKFTEQQKKVLQKVRKGDKNIRTHCRDMVIVPEMVGTLLKVHSGKEFVPVNIQMEMLGHVLGEFVITRKKVQHSAPGIGATKSSSSLSLK